jgi:hypothetical protein
MANQQYIVKTDERWDNIAFKAYGDAGKIEPIVRANPNVLITPTVPAGTILDIPILSEEEAKSLNEILPPWMR